MRKRWHLDAFGPKLLRKTEKKPCAPVCCECTLRQRNIKQSEAVIKNTSNFLRLPTMNVLERDSIRVHSQSSIIYQ